LRSDAFFGEAGAWVDLDGSVLCGGVISVVFVGCLDGVVGVLICGCRFGAVVVRAVSGELTKRGAFSGFSCLCVCGYVFNKVRG